MNGNVKIVHKPYLEACFNILSLFSGLTEEKAKKTILDGDGMAERGINLDVWRLANGYPFDLRHLQTNFLLAHVYMAITTRNERTVYSLEKDLNRALSASSISVGVSEIRFPEESFMLYHNLQFADVGFPQFSQYRVICTHVTIVTNGESLHVQSADIYSDIPESVYLSATTEVQLNSLSNSGYARYVMGLSGKYDKKSFAEHPRTPVPEALSFNAVPGMKTEEFKTAQRELRAQVFHTIVALSAYLQMEQDVQIVPPRYTQKDVESIKNPKKRKRAQKIVDSEYTMKYVGKMYTSGVHEHLKSAGLPHNYNYQIKVPGHFNYYWYGKRTDDQGNRIKGQERKPVWLKPQIKLPDLPEDIRIKVKNVR